MSITEAELREAYEQDTALQAAVLSGQMSEDDWRMYLWYAERLGYIFPNRLNLPVDSTMVLCFRMDVFSLMLQHNRVPTDHLSRNFLGALQGQLNWLVVLERQNPREFRDCDQEFMLGYIPEHLIERYRKGVLLCKELMRANPKAFLPLISDV